MEDARLPQSSWTNCTHVTNALIRRSLRRRPTRVRVLLDARWWISGVYMAEVCGTDTWRNIGFLGCWARTHGEKWWVKSQVKFWPQKNQNTQVAITKCKKDKVKKTNCSSTRFWRPGKQISFQQFFRRDVPPFQGRRAPKNWKKKKFREVSWESPRAFSSQSQIDGTTTNTKKNTKTQNAENTSEDRHLNKN